MKFTTTTAVTAALVATAATAQDLPQADNEWFTAGQAAIEARLAHEPNTNRARNIILLIADGNGVGTNYATRLFMGQQEGGFGDDFVQAHEAMPHLALVRTYNVNAQTPDSAGTGTAMHAGVKTDAGVIGVDADIVRGDCSTIEGNIVTPITHLFNDSGRSVGLISTARLTHATPASAYAFSADRNWEDSVGEGCDGIQVDIAQQLIGAMEAGIVDVAMGGGRRHFLPESVEDIEGRAGRRTDGLDLTEAAAGIGAQVVFDQDGFDGLTLDGTPILGLFESSHMQYEADRDGEPSLAEMTAAAIEALSANEDGFFLSIEAGRVDHALHGGNLARVVRDGEAFADAVQVAMEMTDPSETLIIVTADHEHAIAFNGYCGRGSNILGLCMGIDTAGVAHTGEPNTANDGLPYSVVGFLNGSGSVLVENTPGVFFGARPELTEEEATDLDYLQQALIPMNSETHSGEDVAVYASGPWAHLFDGTIEQNFVFHVMHYAGLVAE